ncbi:hypothetical protein [Flavobacterium sp. PL11]|uniref:hypothetical protein n=1 Tax=Flavobacterium sp. PL11 TaxID=3071717 RepID=UPI002E149331
MTTQPSIESLLEIIAKQAVQIEQLLKRVEQLELELAVYKSKKNSTNNHIAPSKDENRIKTNQSLREKTGEKTSRSTGTSGKNVGFFIRY